MNIKYLLLFLFSVVFFASCNECEECDNLYYEPRVRVIFLKQGSKTLDSAKVRIHSLNGRTDIFKNEDSIARYAFPVRLDSSSSSYSFDYTVYWIRKDSILQEDKTYKKFDVPYTKQGSKRFTIISDATKRSFYNDRYIYERSIDSIVGDTSISLSCKSCYNNEAIIYIYEKG